MLEAFTQNEPVACIDFLPSTHGHSVLVAGNANGSKLALWLVAREGGAMGTPFAVRTYTLELTSSKGGQAAFFNHLLVQPDYSVVVLANTKKQQVGGWWVWRQGKGRSGGGVAVVGQEGRGW